MVGQIVEITDPGHWLNKARGFLEVHHDGEKIGQVPLDDIAAIIISVPGCSLSTHLLDALAQRNIPLVTCGQNYLPSSWTLPIQGHNRQFQIMRAQAQLPEPKRKRAWQSIVKAKIKNQAEVLRRTGKSNARLLRLINEVRSGDPDNCEAQAARAYWQALFGNDFRRDRDMPGLNAALNYSYAIIRACVARGVSSAGLHPSFSLHHKNPQNPLNLVDDLIEPFRPIADIVLWTNHKEIIDNLDYETKSSLATITTLLIPFDNEISPLSLAAAKMARNLAQFYCGETKQLLHPDLPTPLHLSAL